MAKSSIPLIKKDVLAKIIPEEDSSGTVKDVVAVINQAFKANNVKAECVIGGSFAKGTNLKDDFDVDLFVRFDYREFLDADKKAQLSDILEKVLTGIFKNIERVHGSRDYFQLKKGKFDIEIVPVLMIDDPKKAMNVTDMSPMHVEWVRKHKKSDEIRLVKAFCKAAGCYGAESYIKGFSGHVLDILTINYGSFEKFIEAASHWKDDIKKKGSKGKIIIDIYDVYKGKAMERLNRSKTHSPIVIIDPVLPDRNAAAALEKEKFDALSEAAQSFIEKPGISFFKKAAITKDTLKKKAGDNRLIAIEAEALEGKQDVVGAKLLKVFTHIKKYLKINELITYECSWEFDKKKQIAIMYFIVDKKILPETMIQQGPPVKEKAHCEEFMRKHQTTFNEKGRLFAEVKRLYRTPEPLVQDLIKGDYISEKVKSIKSI